MPIHTSVQIAKPVCVRMRLHMCVCRCVLSVHMFCMPI